MKILIESFQNFPNFLSSCNFFICEKSPEEIPLEIRRKLFSTEVQFENPMENTNDLDFDSNNIEEEEIILS